MDEADIMRAPIQDCSEDNGIADRLMNPKQYDECHVCAYVNYPEGTAKQ